MNKTLRNRAHQTAVEVYAAFLEECVLDGVLEDRVGKRRNLTPGKIDGRPVRLITISGKGGWSPDDHLARRYADHYNVSLLDHLLSVVRGALLFYLADTPKPWYQDTDLERVRILAYALAAIGFLHDVDKDLGLVRGTPLSVSNVQKRMEQYGIPEFLRKRDISLSPAAMLNYIEEVEGTQSARSPTAPDYDRDIAATCRYIELADKLDGIFTSTRPGAGLPGVVGYLTQRFPEPDSFLKQWRSLTIHDPLHPFLLDRLQVALSETCLRLTGWMPLVEGVHDGQLVCIFPEAEAEQVQTDGLDLFLSQTALRIAFHRQQSSCLRIHWGSSVLGDMPESHKPYRQVEQ